MDYRKESWYYGKVSRKDAFRILSKTYSRPGDFLVRESERHKGNYVLCVREYQELDTVEETINQYIINVEKDATDSGSLLYIIGERRFRNLNALVEFYSKRLLASSRLMRPAPRDGNTAFNESSDKVIKRDNIEDYDELESNTCPSINDVTLPAMARVVQERIKCPYDPYQLTIKVGDELEVLEINKNGTWQGRLNGVVGSFPFTHIQFLEKRK